MVYVYIIRVRIEGFVVPDVVPKMAAMTDELVRELIAGYKPMGGLGCGEELLRIILPCVDDLARRGGDAQDGADAPQGHEPSPVGASPSGVWGDSSLPGAGLGLQGDRRAPREA